MIRFDVHNLGKQQKASVCKKVPLIFSSSVDVYHRGFVYSCSFQCFAAGSQLPKVFGWWRLSWEHTRSFAFTLRELLKAS